MIRNLKVLGLALAAVFAFSAVGASGAMAEQGQLTTDGERVTLTGSETGAESANGLKAFGSQVVCPGSTYTGHKVLTHEQTTLGAEHVPLTNGDTTATLTPHYNQENCHILGLSLTATVDLNGCDFVIHVGTKVVAGEYNVTFDVVCPPEKDITVTIFHATNPSHTGTPYCTLHVPAQSGLAGARAVNGEGGHINLVGTVKGIKVERTQHGTILCPTDSTIETGEFLIDATVSGHNEEGGATEISLSDEA